MTRPPRRRDPGAALRLPSAIGTDLPGAVPPDLGPIRRVADVWVTVVGEALARFAQPARLTGDRTLVVHAADASWVHAITLEQRTILKRLGEVLGDGAPAGLKVEIGPVDTSPDASPMGSAPPPDAAALAAAEARVRDVEDPRLRDALRTAFARAMTRTAPPSDEA